MKHKLFTLLLAVAASVGTMFAEKVKIGDLYYNLDATKKTAKVTYEVEWPNSNYSGLTTATIPSSVIYYEVEYSVTSIGESAFEGCSGLTSVTIPNSVTSIGEYAFRGCSGLTSVTIPNSITSIGENAFYQCSSLTSIEIPNNVTSIGSWAFFGCSGLTSIEIPNSVTSIGNSAFYACSGLSSIEIPNNVTSIGDGAFFGCIGLTSVTIPNSVTSIGYEAFRVCRGLTSVTIPNSVTSIGDYAFANCSGLTSLTCEATTPPTLKSNVFSYVDKSIPLYVPAESIDLYKAADQWKDFTNILPIEETPVTCITASGTCGAQGDNLTWELSCDSVLTISGTGEMANYSNVPSVPWYSYNSSIQYVVIGNSVTSIGEHAFLGCSGLTSVIVENGNTIYDSRDNCNAIIETATNTLIAGCKNTTIPNSITSIGDGAFYECSGLSSIEIPNNVTSIGDGAFFGCTGLTSPIYNAHIFAYMPTSYSGTYTIPNGIELIAGGAFFACSGLTSATIPNSVTSIGDYAFACCFRLTSVTIPNSATSIGESAFGNCTGLTSVTNYASIPQGISSNVFEEVNKSACTLYVPAGSVDAYKAADVWKEFGKIEGVDVPGEGAGTTFVERVKIGDLYYYLDATNKTAKVTYEVEWPNSNYSGLTTATIPSSVIYYEVEYSVTSIGEWAFSDCSRLTTVTIPNSVTSIGMEAFRNCSSLISVTIPNSVTSIGYEAFFYCSGLTFVTIPNSVTSIGDYAFSGCSGLTSVTIPNSVTSIGELAFYLCKGLTSIIVENGNTIYDSRNNCNAIIETATNTLIAGCKNTTIPNSVTSIGRSAFGGCSGLTSVTIPNSVTSIGLSAFAGCTGLTSVIVENGNTVYDSRDNCNAIIETATNTLIQGCMNTIIPNSVTSIGDGAFAGCSSLISVTIGNSVTSIGDYAFYGCSGLTSVTNYATTPQTITSNVFGGDIDYPGVNKSACTLYVPEESVAAYKAAEGWTEFGKIEGVDVPGEDPTSAPAVYTNPANPAQKLIRNGNVYILTEDNTYTLTGQKVK